MKYSSLLVILLSIFSISCKKDDKDKITTDDLTAASDFSKFFAFYTDVVKVAEDAMDSNYGAKLAYTNLGCTTITVDSNSSAKTYTILYTDNCTSYDGYKRSGTILVTVTNSADKLYNVPGAITTITFTDFTYKNMEFKGSIKMTCVDSSEYEIKLAGTSGNGVAQLWPSGDQSLAITLNTNLLRKTILNSGDDFLLNNKYEYSMVNGGNTIGTFSSQNDKSYTVTFSTKIRQNNSCYYDGFGRFPVSGDITFTDEDEDNFDLQYGDGDCDNEATLARNNTTQSVTY